MSDGVRFKDRIEAGALLARRLASRKLVDPIVLALARGGVPVGVEIARALRAPLDLVLVRKIGVPDQPELAAAAVVNGGSPEIVFSDDVMSAAGVTHEFVRQQAQLEVEEISRRRRVYLSDRQQAPLHQKTVILVDDGIATGTSVRAAITAVKRKSPARLILAIPVAPRETLEALARLVDEIVCLATPEPFYAVGLHYRDFHQVPDDEVIACLRAAQSSIEP
jgi:putative phosphoribosyl transferase